MTCLKAIVSIIDLVTCGSAYVVVLVTGNKCVIIRLVASAIGTFVSIYVLGIGDRHQGNMMVANDHSLSVQLNLHVSFFKLFRFHSVYFEDLCLCRTY